MIYWGAALLLMAWTAAPSEQAARAPERYAQMVVRQQIIVRIPRPQGGEASSSPIGWKEGKGTKCIAASSVMGATALTPDSVDLVLRDRTRIRAKLENSCPALDYYNGFYITPDAEGMICADKQAIRSRMGGECEIDAFRTLKPVRDK